jgi:hypothetical protein
MSQKRRKPFNPNQMPRNLTPEQQAQWKERAADRLACQTFRVRAPQRAFDRATGE